MSMEAPACQNGDDSLGNDDLGMMMTGAYNDASANCDRVLHLVSSSDHCNLSFSFRYFILTFILLLSLYRNTSIERSLQRLNHLVSGSLFLMFIFSISYQNSYLIFPLQ